MYDACVNLTDNRISLLTENYSDILNKIYSVVEKTTILLQLAVESITYPCSDERIQAYYQWHRAYRLTDSAKC